MAGVHVLSGSDVGSFGTHVSLESKGLATFGANRQPPTANRLTTPDGFIEVVSHELRHLDVEGSDEPIGIARNNAVAVKDAAACEAACNLTEGYARCNRKSHRRNIVSKRTSATLAKLTSTSEYQQYSALKQFLSGENWSQNEKVRSRQAFGHGQGLLRQV